MRVVAFCGSHHKDGNTARTIKRVLAGAQDRGAETELVFLGDYRIKPCIGCRVCETTHKCILKDDDVDRLHEAILRADALVLGTPTFYGDITSLYKLFVDRCYPFVEVVRHDAATRELAYGSILEKVKPGIMVAVSGGMGPEIFDSHRRVTSLCLNDINGYISEELLVPYTTWDRVEENHPVWQQAFEAGKRLVDTTLSGAHPEVLNEI